MSTVANVERKIRRVEGFRVHILHLRGADVRGDRAGLRVRLPAIHLERETDIARFVCGDAHNDCLIGMAGKNIPGEANAADAVSR